MTVSLTTPMASPASAALSALVEPLDRSQLHVFVAGPGYGEGIAVALPGEGWILLDGCTVSDNELPLHAILERWRRPNEPIEALLLTHPHQDHAFGIRRTLERYKPRRIGLTTSPSNPGLVFEAAEREISRARPSVPTQRQITLDAMMALGVRFQTAPRDLIALVDGAELPLPGSSARAFIRAPEAAHVHARLSDGRRGDPNELSAVVELVYGDTSVVLGSDLTTVDTHGRPSEGGWHEVLRRHPHLGEHRGLKVPHHGSPAAFHEDLLTEGEGRLWVISPFNRGTRLPPTNPEGVPRLVERNGAVHLTATPRARGDQPAGRIDPAIVTLAELPALFAPAHPEHTGAYSVTPPTSIEPLAPIWCGAFDDRGARRGTWRGASAFSVVR